MAGKSTILVILTGGTIDGYVFPGARPRNKQSHVKNFLKRLKLHEKFQFVAACAKDSRELTDKDRMKIASLIRKSPSDRILVTHGTHTMATTGRYLEKQLGKTGKTVVLTGSLVPFSEPFSDAEFNLGYALRAIQLLNSGVYICMSGKVFKPRKAYKDGKKRIFDELRFL